METYLMKRLQVRAEEGLSRLLDKTTLGRRLDEYFKRRLGVEKMKAEIGALKLGKPEKEEYHPDIA